MNTRQDESLPYLDLARQRARISRQISLDQLPRLESLMVELDRKDDVSTEFLVEMDFRRTPGGLVRIVGEVSGFLSLICNGCAEALACKIALGFDCIIADSDAIAAKLKEESDQVADVVVARDGKITIASIIEDEILLGLPERLCTSSPCSRAPVLFFPGEEAYPAGEHFPVQESSEEVPVKNSEDAEPHPFSVLAQLKTSDP